MEASENDVLSIDVGGRLRELRQERGMSMRALARASGLSTNALSMIERSRTSPSVSTLYKLANAMNIPITAFFRFEVPKQELVFRKAGKRRRVEFPLGGWEGLGGESFIGRLESFLMYLEPEGCSGSEGLIHSGHEFVYCLEGSIEYTVEEETYFLEEGDSLVFDAKRQHRWCNAGTNLARAIIVLAGFEQGESPSEYHVSSGLKGATSEIS
jgi:transcriptional regulator with XRE-family HTH domain